MVEVERTGNKHEVVEVAPADCPSGHRRMAPTWGQCPKPACRSMCRQWRCLEGGCGHRVVDPDHQHRQAAPTESMRRGG